MEKSRQKANRLVRDISWLSFNERVLQEANDPTVSLHNRLKFLGIYSNNMDEFFRVRVATLQRMTIYSKIAKVYMEDSPDKILKQIQERVMKNQKKFNLIYNNILKGMEKESIFMVNEKKLSSNEKKYIQNYFSEEIRSNIVPLMIETIPTAPNLRDKSIYLACILRSTKNDYTRRYALIEVPTGSIDRFIILPTESKQHRIILLEDVIRFCLPNLFSQFGFDSFESYVIKLTRDAELDLDNELDTNFIESIEKGLKKRKKGKALRFIYDKNIDSQMLDYLIRSLHLGKRDHLIPGGRVHNHKDFMRFPKGVFSHHEKERMQTVHPELQQPVRILKVLDKKDILLQVPYHSFDSIIDLLREAAIDPDVTEIKISCYRLAEKSRIVNALINAIQNGKKVTVIIELRARFNEKENLNWKTILEDAGAKVLIGQPHLKIHAKVCLIRKRVKKQIKKYCYISTGNINEDTADFYSDHYLLTSHVGICDEADRLFNIMEDQSRLIECKNFKHLVTSPTGTRDFFLGMIKEETKHKSEGEIIIKLNSLTDDKLIRALENAAIKGVKIKLIIRGISCLVANHSTYLQKIEVVSIVDQYLEHSRIMYFKHADKMYISSSDWMKRNLDHRVEVTVPIYDPILKKQLKRFFDIQLSDNVKTRILDNTQRNLYKKKNRMVQPIRAQEEMAAMLLKEKY